MHLRRRHARSLEPKAGAAPPERGRRGFVLRAVHRTHRWLGAALSLLVGTWFASGAVMTFARYPSWSEEERLAHATPLELVGRAPPSTYALAPKPAFPLPPQLLAWIRAGGLSQGGRARLAMLEGEATWFFTAADGARVALRAREPGVAAKLDSERTRRIVERTFGVAAKSIERISEPDQWTVGRSAPGLYPLERFELDDGAHGEVYVSLASGELVQQSTRSERAWAWAGAIPHWIYPAVLRRQRALWRDSVLWLSGAGLLASLSGLAAGLHATYVRSRRAKPVRAGSRAARRNVYLRYHELLGLAFGVFASTWLFSGALSLEPFHWTGPGPSSTQLEALHGKTSEPEHWPLTAALATCADELSVREAELLSFGGRPLLVCTDAAGKARSVELDASKLAARERLAPSSLDAAAKRLAAGRAYVLELVSQPDAYHYPTHHEPKLTLPYARIELRDPERTTFYVDPERAELLRHYTDLKRLERWLYNGLHSLDLPVLYEHRSVWRSLVIACMALGLALSALGLTVILRRWILRARGPYTGSRTQS